MLNKQMNTKKILIANEYRNQNDFLTRLIKSMFSRDSRKTISLLKDNFLITWS